ncbi:hypothetical protein PoB_000993900 [Plakobranchus ocellatus]|uniref:Uncharacterized protein n=1 Tax=Plakobranchus ocellatus TaxID=259542 RepID=A0AAV3YMU3_9GAST|nr:hypothetical protein PoB_000993900 [Plakobranchus ocellatus]
MLHLQRGKQHCPSICGELSDTGSSPLLARARTPEKIPFPTTLSKTTRHVDIAEDHGISHPLSSIDEISCWLPQDRVDERGILFLPPLKEKCCTITDTRSGKEK